MTKSYVITFHKEGLSDTYSKRTAIKTAKSASDAINELQESWCKENPNMRIVVDFIYSEDDK